MEVVRDVLALGRRARCELHLSETVGSTRRHRSGGPVGGVLDDSLEATRRVMQLHGEGVALVEELHLVRVWRTGCKGLELHGVRRALRLAAVREVREVHVLLTNQALAGRVEL